MAPWWRCNQLVLIRALAASTVLGSVSLLLAASIQLWTWTTDESSWHRLRSDNRLSYVCKAPVEDGKCPTANWNHRSGLCYALSTNLMLESGSHYLEWLQAEWVCASLSNKSHLASISSAEENAIVMELCAWSGYECWIGVYKSLLRPNTSGESEAAAEGWTWSDGTLLEYENWASVFQEPADDGQAIIAAAIIPRIIDIVKSAYAGTIMFGWTSSFINCSVIFGGFSWLHKWLKNRDANAWFYMLACDSICVCFLVIAAVISLHGLARAPASALQWADALMYWIEAACLTLFIVLGCRSPQQEENSAWAGPTFRHRVSAPVHDVVGQPTVVGAHAGQSEATILHGDGQQAPAAQQGVVIGGSAFNQPHQPPTVVVGTPVRNS